MHRLTNRKLWIILGVLLALIFAGGITIGFALRGSASNSAVAETGGSGSAEGTSGSLPGSNGDEVLPDREDGSDLGPGAQLPEETGTSPVQVSTPGESQPQSEAPGAAASADAGGLPTVSPGVPANIVPRVGPSPTSTLRSSGGVSPAGAPTATNPGAIGQVPTRERTETPTTAPTIALPTRTPTPTRPVNTATPTNTDQPPNETAVPTITSTPTATPTETLIPTITLTPTQDVPEPPIVMPADPLERLNYYRAAAGLSAITFDETLSFGAQKHAEYMAAHNRLSTTEDTSDPLYTPEGAASAAQSNLWYGGGVGIWQPTHSVDAWMRSPYHRLWMLYPQAVRMGFGYTENVESKGSAAVLHLFGGWDPTIPFDSPIGYPAPGQTGVPFTRFGVSLQFPVYTSNPTITTTTWLDENGLSVPFRRYDPSNDSYMRDFGNAVFLLPQNTLIPSTTYTVRIVGVYEGQPFDYQWNFTTGGI